MGLPVLLLRAGKEGETNTKWVAILLQDYLLPSNVVATTSAAEACAGAQYAIHAVPVQHSRAFLHAIKVHICSRACFGAWRCHTPGCFQAAAAWQCGAGTQHLGQFENAEQDMPLVVCTMLPC